MKTGKTLSELAAEIERQHATKKDFIASTQAIEVAKEGNGLLIDLPSKGTFTVGEIAHNQIAEHTKIPNRYYDYMRTNAPELLATNVQTWFNKYPAPRMIRTLDGNARAFLSDKFNTLDNYDFAGAALPILAERKLQVTSCEITEKRLYIKAIDTQLFRDVPIGFKMGDGSHKIFDTVAPVIMLSNSEVGFGRLVVDTGVYTSACTNLAMFAKGGLKRTHVGARHKLLDDNGVGELDEILSQGTKRKTMEALWLQVRDVIAAAFDGAVIAKRVEALEVAAGRKITGKVEKVMEIAAERFSLAGEEKDSIFKHLIEGGSLTQYGLHAAITRAAQDVASYDRATELEYLGGKVVELPRTEWETLAEAA